MAEGSLRPKEGAQEMNRHAVYLGDGAYCREGSYPGEIVVYTSNGEWETNRVVLGPNEWETLKAFVTALFTSYEKERS